MLELSTSSCSRGHNKELKRNRHASVTHEYISLIQHCYDEKDHNLMD